MSTTRTSLLVIAMMSVGLIVSGCGGSQGQSLVSGVQLSAHQEQDGIFVKFTSQLNTGGTQMVGFSLDVLDPKNPGQSYGTISMVQSFSGVAELSLDVNLSRLVELDTVPCLLPNGTPIPVAGISAPIICINVGHNVRIYAAYGNGAAMLGASVAINEFNGIGGYVGNTNIFPTFNFGSGIVGIGGIFAGVQGAQSGIALFVDASGKIAATVGAQSSELKSSASLSKASVKKERVLFNAPAASSKTKDKVNKLLYKLHLKRARLHSN